ncbi:MAG: prepilin-type N-terminal cleavage/methylation domain-containing protein [Methylococcales bacterium]|nr:prepilin-type N-terminal cleavage/methylation domain-containing protein [Methylococcales bacterium]
MNRATKFSPKEPMEAGFTLIELMISIVIGLIVLSAVISMFVTMIKSDNDNLKSIRLNQQLRAAMSLITRDIRRAGFDGLGATRAAGSYPFSTPLSRLTIGNNDHGNANSCVGFAYDEDKDGIDDGNAERYGYRWDSVDGAIEIRKSGIACTVGGWENLTDETLIELFPETIAGVTHPGLEFVETFVIEACMYIRQIEITIRGRLRKDNTVARTISEIVKIRNEDTGPVPCP